MTILYASTATVKSPRTFGRGILRSAPVHRVDYTASDAAWWAANAPANTEPDWDRLAAEFLATESASLSPRFDDSAIVC